MGRQNRQRRVAKRRKITARQGRVLPSSAPPSTDREHRSEDTIRRERVKADLLSVIGAVWTRGWQPVELVRHVRRSGLDPWCQDLLAIAVAIESQTAEIDVHPIWASQVRGITARFEPIEDDWLDRGDCGRDRINSIVGMVALLARLPRLARLIPSPGNPSVDVVVLVGEVRGDPLLDRIRSLLAKAESTEFPAEAEAFTAKAQSLITSARLDEAALRGLRAPGGGSGRVSAIRVPIDEPYLNEKRILLAAIAAANDARTIGERDLDLVTVVGPSGQLLHIELLFTSLLIQLQSALITDASSSVPGDRRRSRRYRASFIAGFACRIGERLAAAGAAAVDNAPGTALPVLVSDREAVDELIERMFTQLTNRLSVRDRDLMGLTSGAAAADRVRLRDEGLAGGSRRSTSELPSGW